jgi:hypothetical protein
MKISEKVKIYGFFANFLVKVMVLSVFLLKEKIICTNEGHVALV